MTNWPRLDFEADRPTIETLHMILQLVGELPLRLHPWINHGWHVALRMTPRGMATRSLPAGEQHFSVELDIIDACLRIACDSGGLATVPVAQKSIADVQSGLREALAGLNLPAPLHGGPNELPQGTPFAQDREPREWSAGAATRLHRAFLSADHCFNAYRSLYRGKTSPNHLFWGSFDLAVTRFSGRRAPPHPGGIPNLPDAVTREAYSHEEISAGFWPGNGGFGEAAFYAYAYPTPDGLSDRRVAPEGARWHGDLGEFVLPYRLVREAADPHAEVLRFLDSTFAAAAEMLDWPEGEVVGPQPVIGQPPAV